MARLDRREGTAASLLNLDFTDTVAVWGGNVMGGQGWRGALPAPTLCQFSIHLWSPSGALLLGCQIPGPQQAAAV